MRDRLQPFTVYWKKTQPEVLSFHHFTIDLLEGGEYTVSIFDSSGKRDGALGFRHIAAIVPEVQRHGFYGYTVKLKNGQSFNVAGSSFTIEPPRVVFYFGRGRSEPPDKMNEIYVASSEVVSIFPAKGLDWDS